MPKATLLVGQNYLKAVGRSMSTFTKGKEKSVSVQVALALKGLKAADGSLLFKVEDMPTIIKPDPEVKELVRQNVENFPRQLRFESWPLSAS